MLRPRATVRLGLDCNNRCIFCAQDGLEAGAGPSALRQLEDGRATSDAVTFIGGEPTLDPALIDHVGAARAKGFARIGLQTNGGLLSGELAIALAAAGLSDVHLSVHGAEATVHDYHTGVDGSFALAISALAAARAAGLTVVVTTVLTRSNARVLAPLARLLGARGAAAWLIEVPRVAGRAADTFDRVVPRLGLAVPFALHALETASTLGLPAWIRGAPLCLLGPFAWRALRDERDERSERSDGDRTFSEACASCEARPECSGVEPPYLARFGDGELSPREAPKARRDYPELRAMFVGVGELALRMTRKLEPPPARARVALPILGKVKPAIAEATSGTERRSGTALREIFPALFEDPIATRRES